MIKEKLLERVENLINQGKEVLLTKFNHGFHGELLVHCGKQSSFRSASRSFISSLFGENHSYFKDFTNYVQGQGYGETENGIGILESIKNEIEHDYLFTIRDLISSEIFSDFMEMSKYFLDKGYKDAAAVMIGSVLEEHLRSLCTKNSLDVTIEKNGKLVHLRAEELNTNLRKEEVYGVLEQKNITAWLDLRNKAAHGKYDDYTKEQVDLLYQNVLNFIMQFR